jgi:hypothetical protein
MEVRSLELPLTGFGVPTTSAEVEFLDLSLADRLKRAGVTFGLGVALALIAVPIPLVHFVLVPAALLLGAALALVRLRQSQIFRWAHARCPFCGTEQNFSVMGKFKLPKTLSCGSCQRQLILEPTSEPPRSPT